MEQQRWGTLNSTNDLVDIFHKLLECEMIFISDVELIHLLMTQPKSVRRVNTRCWFTRALPRSIIFLSAYRGIDGRQRNQVNLALERKSFKKKTQTVLLFAVNTDVFRMPRLQLNTALQKAWLRVLAYFQYALNMLWNSSSFNNWAHHLQILMGQNEETLKDIWLHWECEK